ncbi:hypothetical protein MetMK1DRAFT_00003370 [Metallosphaera yellowstonensis MK1]|uniref:Transposase DDE domain-containing protein n=1 Tax=Metallosphaera yellowstonensis MK1 TaxID=671065 RepID=H2C4P3_9CREN|nr:hypothetical protein MetMK1DRAFT_00003370 [Metallosphaera yellowstonensis MK1]
MGKSEYKRDWHKYDENVITRYELMFPFYVFQHWWELLAEENRDAKKTYKAPKEFNEFLAFLHLFLPYRAMEGVLRALEGLKIVPTSLDYSTIWERVRNMDITFPEANDELEVADATGMSTTRGGQYVVAKWGKTRDSKFLKIEIVMDKDELNVIDAEVTSDEVETAVKTKDLQDRGRRSGSFTGIRLTTPTRFTILGLRSSHLGRTPPLDAVIPLGCEGVQGVGLRSLEGGEGLRC